MVMISVGFTRRDIGHLLIMPSNPRVFEKEKNTGKLDFDHLFICSPLTEECIRVSIFVKEKNRGSDVLGLTIGRFASAWRWPDRFLDLSSRYLGHLLR